MKSTSVSLLLLAVAAASEGTVPKRQISNSNGYSVTFYQISSDSIIIGADAQVLYNASLDVTTPSHVDNLALLLLQTSAVGDTAINSGNTVLLVDLLPYACIYNHEIADCINPQEAIKAGQTMFTPVLFQLAAGYSTNDSLNNMFFCFATIDGAGGPSVCNYYSNIFAIAPAGELGGTAPNIAEGIVSISGSIAVTSTVTTILSTLVPSTVTLTTSASSSLTGSTVTTSTPTGMTTIPAATETSSSTTTSSKSIRKSSLSVGAKVGIALGALALVALLLLLALFFLRRKHSKRATEHHQPEQVMLTRSMHTDSFGRPAIITEKEEAISSAAALNRAGDSPVHGSGGGGIPEVVMPAPVPQTRHTVLSPYDPIPSAPYTGTIGTSNNNKNNIPRRKPTAATMASTVSRGLSTASSVSAGPISPRSAHTGSGTTASGSGEFEAYHDVRVYGDARHVPQVFSATRIPFLGEETQGMSPEEVARLEEEERRIDLAIAEAERR